MLKSPEVVLVKYSDSIKGCVLVPVQGKPKLAQIRVDARDLFVLELFITVPALSSLSILILFMHLPAVISPKRALEDEIFKLIPHFDYH